jgi:hypothetical protein
MFEASAVGIALTDENLGGGVANRSYSPHSWDSLAGVA